MNAPAKSPRQQRQLRMLVILGVVLAVIIGIQVLPSLSGSTPPPRPAPVVKPAAAAPSASATRRPGTPSRGPGSRGTRGAGQAVTGRNGGNGNVLSGVEEVHLAQLKQPEPEPIEGHRNPFGFGADPKPASSLAAKGGGANVTPMQPPPALPVATGPPPVPPPPPITLKFFGVVTAPGRIGRVAALGDGKFVYHGREGEIVEGRYRIVKIGEESIQLEYVDGRGRQTIRLSGK